MISAFGKAMPQCPKCVELRVQVFGTFGVSPNRRGLPKAYRRGNRRQKRVDTSSEARSKVLGKHLCMIKLKR